MEGVGGGGGREGWVVKTRACLRVFTTSHELAEHVPLRAVLTDDTFQENSECRKK